MTAYFVITIGALLVVNVLMWVLFMPRYMDRKIRRFQNELVDKHYDEVETMYRKMRGWRHDYHNHIQTLNAQLELEQYKEAKEYLAMLAEDLNSVDTVLKTGNVMVDAILNSKLTVIREKGIPVDATAIVPHDISISGVDLSVLIGNLLDNAMEACMRIDSSDDRFIRIYIDIIKKQFYISVTNSMAGTVRRNGLAYQSSKKGVHGFGMLRMDRIVSKYGGFINRQNEHGVFATEVMIPLTKIE